MKTQLEKETEILNNLRIQFQKICDEVATQEKIVESLSEKVIKKTLSDNPSLEDLMIVHDETGIESTVRYKAFLEYIDKNFGGLKRCGVSNYGYYPETNQRSFKIWIDSDAKDKHLEKLADILTKELLPVMKPMKLGVLIFGHTCLSISAEYKSIKIMEETCGEHGIYRLITNDNSSQFGIIKIAYGRIHDIMPLTNNLTDVLFKIRADIYRALSGDQ